MKIKRNWLKTIKSINGLDINKTSPCQIMWLLSVIIFFLLYILIIIWLHHDQSSKQVLEVGEPFIIIRKRTVLSMAPHSIKSTVLCPTILDFVHSYTESGKKIWPASDSLLFWALLHTIIAFVLLIDMPMKISTMAILPPQYLQFNHAILK